MSMHRADGIMVVTATQLHPEKLVPEKKKKHKGPESEHYDLLKGKRVWLTYRDGTDQYGVLHWVDFYTLGVTFSDDVGLKSLVYKQDLRCIREDP